jgi:methylase of polypeptide subunit release factors
MTPLFDGAERDLLRAALERSYTSHAVSNALGLAGQSCLARGDLDGAERLTRGGSPTETLIRLFVLGLPVARSRATISLQPLPLEAAVAAGLVRTNGDETTALLDLRPYSEQDGPDWWVISDVAADVRPGVLDGEHVLGVGSAATTLAQSTVRAPVERALDVGTGCGVQALHLSRHSRSVTATDLSSRALQLAATTAALNGLSWRLRQGSLLDPVAGEQFDLIVCNPPFIVGPGFTSDNGGFTYRDSGFAGDGVSRRLIEQLPGALGPGGTAQLLANWEITGEQDWSERLEGWLAGGNCDAWIWQREVADPAEYVSLWLRDGGERPRTPSWTRRYNEWLDWFAATGVLGIGMGLVSLRRTDAVPQIVCEDLPQAIEQPTGAEILAWFDRLDWHRRLGDGGLLDARLQVCADLVRETRSVLTDGEWSPAYSQLRQSHGLRWEIETDTAIAALVAGCDGTTKLSTVVTAMAALLDLPATDVATAITPIAADLLRRGILLPPADGH